MKNPKTNPTHYNRLTDAQRESIWTGNACGHPTNRPKNVAEAKRWTWYVREDNAQIYGFSPGAAFGKLAYFF